MAASSWVQYYQIEERTATTTESRVPVRNRYSWSRQVSGSIRFLHLRDVNACPPQYTSAAVRNQISIANLKFADVRGALRPAMTTSAGHWAKDWLASRLHRADRIKRTTGIRTLRAKIGGLPGIPSGTRPTIHAHHRVGAGGWHAPGSVRRPRPDLQPYTRIGPAT